MSQATPNSNSPSELSFLPEDYLARRARRRANILCGTMSVIVMGTVAAAFAVTERSMRTLDATMGGVDRQYDEAAFRIAQVQKLRNAQRAIAQHAELAETLVEKVPRTNLLAELTNALPAGASLIDFQLETTRAASKDKPAEVKMHVTGIADNDVEVAQFITKLDSSKLLTDVNLLISDSFAQDKVVLRRFQIEFALNPDAEVRPPAPAVADRPPATVAGVDLSK